MQGGSKNYYSKINTRQLIKSSRLCEGVSRSSQTELIMKYMNTFLTGHCHPLHARHFPSPCYRSTVGTNETDFWGLQVGKSEIYPEFLRYPGNNPSQLQFHSWKQEEIVTGQIRWVWKVMIQRCAFSSQRLPLTLLVSQQPRHKLHRDPQHVKVLPQNSWTCSTCGA